MSADFRWARRGPWTRNATDPDCAWSACASSRDALPEAPTADVLDWFAFSDTDTPGPDGWEAEAADGTRFVVFRVGG